MTYSYSTHMHKLFVLLICIFAIAIACIRNTSANYLIPPWVFVSIATSTAAVNVCRPRARTYIVFSGLVMVRRCIRVHIRGSACARSCSPHGHMHALEEFERPAAGHASRYRSAGWTIAVSTMDVFALENRSAASAMMWDIWTSAPRRPVCHNNYTIEVVPGWGSSFHS